MVTIERMITEDSYEWLTKFRSLGGVIDFKIIQVSGAASLEEAHFEAAKATLEFIKNDIDDHFKKLAISSGTPGGDYYAISNLAFAITDGNPITVKDFFGP